MFLNLDEVLVEDMHESREEIEDSHVCMWIETIIDEYERCIEFGQCLYA